MEQDPESRPAAAPEQDEIGRAWAYLAAANSLLAQRFNYALVAHAMALAAYAACVAGVPLVSLVVATAALLYCFVQYKITYPLSRRIDALREAYLLNDPVYRAYHGAPGGNRRRQLQSIVVPAGLALMWTALIAIALASVVPRVAERLCAAASA